MSTWLLPMHLYVIPTGWEACLPVGRNPPGLSVYPFWGISHPLEADFDMTGFCFGVSTGLK
ncbi:MAG: hypothetical protein COW63_11520 [Bacteroidetes bacterium CG18_big_fil_WC_8_21_14_2_50_41_14]|nr:MAG: hypothetical protein COW63_11520 [Bacteroidetes bacterium CG18_big_fil_WC_8_21_14_2_50_41_14]PJB58583.1 MAG: hypothetical protein CO098_07850 [Bacteroidetes bacterium CG_4_9_14_3_um_filter_41_19]